MSERWLPVPGFEGLYEVSDLGRVRSLDRLSTQVGKGGSVYTRHLRGRILNLTAHSAGYHCVHLAKDGKAITATVHGIVAEAFLGPRRVGTEVCHWNGRRTDSRLVNLRYGTCGDNHDDARRHGTLAVGSRNGQAKLTEEDIPYIRSLERQMSQQAAADRVGMSSAQIGRIWSREAWRHV